ncbi:MAG: CBS domain-containing protein [Caldilineaceae bacterium]
MLIRDCMTRHPILAPLSLRASEAQALMAENNIRHLPVVGDGKRLVGLITRECLSVKADMLGSLNVWEISRFLSDQHVRDLMVRAKDVITIDPNRTVERAAAMMTEHKIGCLPVLEEGGLVVGIVTETDLLRSYQEMLGLPSEGVRVTVRMPNRHGEFVKLMAVLAEHDWGVMGIGTFPTRRDPDSYDVVLKIPNVTMEEVQGAFSTVPSQTVVDIRAAV